ncbi:MAG: hypothetical protein IPJ27_19760 [Candidatus Accumulibacter sp.]|uniref:Uncharacterized protein n=1 Tax=Candidatus Accumulibacter proximus TaxID=2954385 RepID=A0A935Q305_9PROT|nr:hypothetical protein [Candidatus Accumulibacter proximus]
MLIDVTWPKATLASQSIPEMDGLGALRADVEIPATRRAGTDEAPRLALGEQVLQRTDVLVAAEVVTPRPRM